MRAEALYKNSFKIYGKAEKKALVFVASLDKITYIYDNDYHY
jgi:hypothetical protein